MGKKRKKNLSKSLLIPLFILAAIIASLLFSLFKFSPSYSPTDPTDYICEGDKDYLPAMLGKSTAELCLDEGSTPNDWYGQSQQGKDLHDEGHLKGICGAQGYFYIDADSSQSSRDAPITIKIPSALQKGVYKINIWYSTEDYQPKEDFKIICKLNGDDQEYKFADVDLINNCDKNTYCDCAGNVCKKKSETGAGKVCCPSNLLNTYHSLKDKPGLSSYNSLCSFDPINSELNSFQIDTLDKRDQGSVHIEKFQLLHCILKESPLPPPPPPPHKCTNDPGCASESKTCDATRMKVIECSNSDPTDTCLKETITNCPNGCENGKCNPPPVPPPPVPPPGIPPVVGEAKFAQLPFFNLFNFITTIMAIALIYILINISKPSKKYC